MQTKWSIESELEEICSAHIGKDINDELVGLMAHDIQRGIDQEITRKMIELIVQRGIDQEIIRKMIELIGKEKFPTVELRESGSILGVPLAYPAGTIGFKEGETVKVWSREKHMEEFTFKCQMSLKDFMWEYFADLIV